MGVAGFGVFILYSVGYKDVVGKGWGQWTSGSVP